MDGWLDGWNEYTVSMQLDAHLSSSRNPMFCLKVIVKYDVTQLESRLSISPNPLFALDLPGNTLCVYARGYSKWPRVDNKPLCSKY